MSNKNDIRIFTLNAYIKPDIKETQSKDWVLNGKYNSFYDYIIARYNGSPTNAAIINTYIDLIYGKGLQNMNSNIEGWLQFNKMIKPDDIRRIITDFELFGEAILQGIPAKNSNKPPTLYHLPKEKTAPKKRNDDNEIEGYYYCENWRSPTGNKEPEYYPIISHDGKSSQYCYPIRPYKAGKIYFSDPDYLACMQYAELEEEISNYYLSHILNGLSFGYIINIPNGNAYTPEEKEQIEEKVRRNLTGSSNSGRFIINFNGREAEITVTAIEVNDAHKQWEYLTGEARQQILTGHRVTSPMLFGIKDNTGLGNNANELDVAEMQLMKRIIEPKQKYITDAFEEIAALYGIQLDLKFKPITSKEDIIQAQQPVKFSSSHPVDELISLGRDVDLNEYDVFDDSEVDYDNNEIELQFAASTGTARTEANSMQDSKEIIIRYKYVGNPNPEREFCKRMMSANKLYRKEDIELMETKSVNPGFGMSPNPNEPYSIWLYKGGGLLSKDFPGGTCKHKWNRVIFLRKDASEETRTKLGETISTTKARSKGYKVPTNDSKVSIAPHDM